MTQEIEGNVILITGDSTSIGAKTAWLLAGRRAEVARINLTGTAMNGSLADRQVVRRKPPYD